MQVYQDTLIDDGTESENEEEAENLEESEVEAIEE